MICKWKIKNENFQLRLKYIYQLFSIWNAFSLSMTYNKRFHSFHKYRLNLKRNHSYFYSPCVDIRIYFTENVKYISYLIYGNFFSLSIVICDVFVERHKRVHTNTDHHTRTYALSISFSLFAHIYIYVIGVRNHWYSVIHNPIHMNKSFQPYFCI